MPDPPFGQQVPRLRLPGVSRDRDALTLDIVAAHIMLHAAGEHVALTRGQPLDAYPVSVAYSADYLKSRRAFARFEVGHSLRAEPGPHRKIILR